MVFQVLLPPARCLIDWDRVGNDVNRDLETSASPRRKRLGLHDDACRPAISQSACEASSPTEARPIGLIAFGNDNRQTQASTSGKRDDIGFCHKGHNNVGPETAQQSSKLAYPPHIRPEPWQKS